MTARRMGGLEWGTGLLKRRGLLAGAAALVAGGLAELSTVGRVEATHGNPPAGAADGMDTRALHIGGSNTQSSGTITSLNGATGAALVSFRNTTSLGGGLSASGSTSSLGGGYGVRGICGDSVLSNQPTHVGVHGIDVQHGGSVGVRGDATAIGVLGRSSFAGGQLRDGTGVRGESNTGLGVYGEAVGGTGVSGTSTTGVGTIGISRDAAGVYGFSSSGVGVFGTSPTNVGLFGQASQSAGVFGDSPVNGVWGRTATGIGVKGEATSNGIGVYGRAPTSGWAGYFFGNVYVTGTVTQGGMASPQAASAQTIESFGEAQLVNGQATVTLDRETADAVGGGAYQVVLTEYGNIGGLYVHQRGATAFEVRSRGAAAGSFGYRVMARDKQPARRGAAHAEAMPSVTIPKDLPVPTAPELPKIDESRAGREGPSDDR